MSHDHDHGAHDPIQASDRVSEFEILERAVRELAIEKGLFSEEDHRRFSEWAESLGPSGGSKLVARAWTDPEFKALLLADGTEACKEVGIDWLDPTGVGTPSDYTYFYVLENTPEVHNVIVCTLCSCYPRPVLGMSPDWYRTPNYRRRLVRWPAKCWPSSACTSALTSRCGCTTPTRSRDSWSCRCAPTAPKGGRRSVSRRSSPGTP